MTGSDGGQDALRDRRHLLTRRRQKRRARLITLTVLAVLAVVASGVLIAVGVSGLEQPHDLRGKSVAISNEIPSGNTIARMHVVADLGERFIVPSVGLNVPLGALDEADGTITPPGFTSAYVVRNLGATLQRADRGTVFVAMHSVRGGGVGPGNYLINVASGRPSVSAGDTIRVGPRTYRVISWRNESKQQVPYDVALWANTPGRLVVLTCLQNPSQTESTENVIITAELQK